MKSRGILKKLRRISATGFFLAIAAFAVPLANDARAQESNALINVLVKKGILSSQEAGEIHAELSGENQKTITRTLSGGKKTSALSLTGRVQVQYAGISSSLEQPAGQPHMDGASSTSHFFLRRVYLGAKARLGSNWSANINYDFAGELFDKAYLEWAGDIGGLPFAFDAGLRKVNFGYEEYTSSGSLKAIERSAVTRYFAEDNNGRRLGAASYRVGFFADYNPKAFSGKATGFFAGVAITNPERVGESTSIGDHTNNNPAYWANAGYSGKAGDLKYRAGVAIAWLPDQGGAGNANRGKDLDIQEGSVYADVSYKRFQAAAEFIHAKLEESAGGDNRINGVWVQPSLKIAGGVELVARYSYLDTDGRGVRVSDGARSAPSIGGAATAGRMHEYYAGINYYVLGDDLKIQLGYVGAKTFGADRNETVHGVRSQIQVNF